ncbi:hypothetical protein Cato_55 [Acinetobacter phage Cato]|nr:hypothetical protein Cato_55 [Acinetobacter phage Cato]
MNKGLILKAVNLVFEFNEKFYCAEKGFKLDANIDIGSTTLRLSIHGGREWIYYENSGFGYEMTNEENLNNFIEKLTKLMEGSK